MGGVGGGGVVQGMLLGKHASSSGTARRIEACAQDMEATCPVLWRESAPNVCSPTSATAVAIHVLCCRCYCLRLYYLRLTWANVVQQTCQFGLEVNLIRVMTCQAMP
eukprot:5328581-Amphidinium_carterae.1